MVTEPAHIDEGVLDLVLTDVPDVIGIRVGAPVETSDHNAVSIDAVLQQPIPHLVCLSQELCRLGAGERRCEGS